MKGLMQQHTLAQVNKIFTVVCVRQEVALSKHTHAMIKIHVVVIKSSHVRYWVIMIFFFFAVMFLSPEESPIIFLTLIDILHCGHVGSLYARSLTARCCRDAM